MTQDARHTYFFPDFKHFVQHLYHTSVHIVHASGLERHPTSLRKLNSLHILWPSHPVDSQHGLTTGSIKPTVNENNCNCPTAAVQLVLILSSSWPPAATVNLSSSGARAYVNSALTRHLAVFKHARDTSQHKVTVENTLLRDLRAGCIIGWWKRKEEDKLEEVKKKKNRAAGAKQGDEDGGGRNRRREATSSCVPCLKQGPFPATVSVPQWKKPHAFRLLEITKNHSDLRTLVCFSSPLSLSLYTRLTLYCHGNNVTVSHLHISLLLNTSEK